ncbi:MULTISPECIES: hypothetical protein [unclassified Neisseria]|uniref:hypothetical protein n=1 Tax=unclassified Neisseria TaxID=2623750 RepID=UPI001072D647|nr:MULTISPECIES: hypothetical protein [unclassified Neisseria]MBF0803167.1 hypothetical protein [Neisseria sp. 19428wB4_WF04]TFU44141.1 hypothetical protein E4T99_02140 [Neisseria sp. WF04]
MRITKNRLCLQLLEKSGVALFLPSSLFLQKRRFLDCAYTRNDAASPHPCTRQSLNLQNPKRPLKKKFKKYNRINNILTAIKPARKQPAIFPAGQAGFAVVQIGRLQNGPGIPLPGGCNLKVVKPTSTFFRRPKL